MELCTRYTAAWRLFNLRFECMASPLIRYTTEYLQSGYYIQNVTGDREVDKGATGRFDKTRLTAAAIAMFIGDGHSIGLINVKDCVQIYHDVQEHLNDWRDQCNYAAHAGEFPEIEELQMFENLALEMYEHAQRLEPRTEQRSALFDSLLNMNRRRNLISTNKWMRERTHDGQEIKPYVSIVADIERFVAEIQ